MLTGKVWYLLNPPSVFPFFQGPDPFLAYAPYFSCSTMPSNARLLHFVRLYPLLLAGGLVCSSAMTTTSTLSDIWKAFKNINTWASLQTN